jgi:hypothetical protein
MCRCRKSSRMWQLAAKGSSYPEVFVSSAAHAATALASRATAVGASRRRSRPVAGSVHGTQRRVGGGPPTSGPRHPAEAMAGCRPPSRPHKHRLSQHRLPTVAQVHGLAPRWALIGERPASLSGVVGLRRPRQDTAVGGIVGMYGRALKCGQTTRCPSPTPAPSELLEAFHAGGGEYLNRESLRLNAWN